MTIAFYLLCFYLSQYFPITGIEDARVSEMLEYISNIRQTKVKIEFKDKTVSKIQ